MTSWFGSKKKGDAPPPPGVGGTKVPEGTKNMETDPLLTTQRSSAPMGMADAYSRQTQKNDPGVDELPEHKHSFHSAMAHGLHKHSSGIGIGKFILGWLFMSLLPWLLFMGIGVLFIMLYYYFAPIMWFGIIVAGMVCLMTIVGGRSGEDSHHGLWWSVMGAFILVTLMAATVCGLMNFHQYMFHYWSALEGRQYTNVAPDALAAAHEDAGMIVFSDDATVDITKPIGFKAGEIFCVAPILRADAVGSDIQYWAAGTNCCRGRDFFTCNDVLNKDARSGVVIRDEMSPIEESNLKYYKHAAQTAVETYGLTQVKEPIFVHWVKDIEQYTAELFFAAWLQWGNHGIAFFFFCLICGALMQVLVMAKGHAVAKAKTKADMNKV